ncbi:MAG TPA: cyclase family protein [Ktedonobacterales bacterium]|nr:cyclase family protein [Ktedonobacterales bacterium]
MAERWIDLSVPLHDGMVHWPDNPPVKIERMLDIERGDTANVSMMALAVHTGTHVDAPRHFLREGLGVHLAPFSALIGPARVIELADPTSVTVAELQRHDIQGGERMPLGRPDGRPQGFGTLTGLPSRVRTCEKARRTRAGVRRSDARGACQGKRTSATASRARRSWT